MRARALWALGRGFAAQGRLDETHDVAVEAAQAAASAGAVAWEGEAWLLAGMVRAFAGEYRIEELRRGLDRALEAGDPSGAGHGYQFVVDILDLAGRRAEALQVALEGIAACDRLGVSASHGSDVRGQAALLLIDAGRWPEADDILRPADPRATPSLARALLAIRRGDFAGADAFLAAAAVGGSIGGPGIRGGPLELARAELAWLRGDLDAACRELESITFVPGVWEREMCSRRALWETRLGVAATKDSEPGPLQAERTARAEQTPAAWARAVEAWRSQERPYDEGWARLWQAEAAFATGDRTAGREALHEAIRIAEGLGAGPLLRRAENLAKRARVQASPTRAAPSDPSELTARERDVLELVAEGRTNRQIAEALFLSPKTVGIHVSRILSKLGAATRGEAAAVARRRARLSDR